MYTHLDYEDQFWSIPNRMPFLKQSWDEEQDKEEDMDVTEEKKNHVDKEEDEESDGDVKDESKANGDSDLDPESEEE